MGTRASPTRTSYQRYLTGSWNRVVQDGAMALEKISGGGRLVRQFNMMTIEAYMDLQPKGSKAIDDNIAKTAETKQDNDLRASQASCETC